MPESPPSREPPDSAPRPPARKGRGAASNTDGRFEPYRHEAEDDGWDSLDEPLAPLQTIVGVDAARTVISRNDSPDIPFDRSINPYRGCEHGCVYCLSGDTPILMGNGTTRPLADVRVDDVIYGTERRGWYRRYVKARVRDHWSVVKPAYRITLEDGTTLVASGDHRFLTERGWKFVVGATAGAARRPHFTTGNKLMGTGAFAGPPVKGRDYRQGYLCGLIRGDGLPASYHYERVGRVHGDQHQFRLALCDSEALARAREFLQDWQIATHGLVFQQAVGGRRSVHAIRAHARTDVERIRALIGWPERPSTEWSAGFLAGIFDAEGSYSDGILRISNTDSGIIARITEGMRAFGFRVAIEPVTRERAKPLTVVRLVGGLRESLRFFHSVYPAISRKLDISGQAVKSEARLRVIGIEPLGRAVKLYDITTDTGDFIANGVVSHNCYARPTHAYLGHSPGLDFETHLYAKPDAAALLRKELRAPGYKASPIALGTNTDPYQPIERRYGVTRAILEVLAECEHPVTIVTKSARVERDLDLLAPMAAKNLAQVHLSVTTLKHELARRLEPRASSPARRLEAVRALSAAGVPTGVMVAPIIPVLTDGELEDILEAAHAAGAASAGYVLLRLPHEVKDLFKEWLAEHAPLSAAHVMARVRETRAGKENDPSFGTRMRGQGAYAEAIAQRFRLACRRLGLPQRGRLELDTARFRPPQEAGDQLDMF